MMMVYEIQNKHYKMKGKNVSFKTNKILSKNHLSVAPASAPAAAAAASVTSEDHIPVLYVRYIFYIIIFSRIAIFLERYIESPEKVCDWREVQYATVRLLLYFLSSIPGLHPIHI